MKIRKKYVLCINDMLKVAYYKKTASSNDISMDSILDIWDCSFNELKQNIKVLESRGYHCLPSRI